MLIKISGSDPVADVISLLDAPKAFNTVNEQIKSGNEKNAQVLDITNNNALSKQHIQKCDNITNPKFGTKANYIRSIDAPKVFNPVNEQIRVADD